NKSLNQTIPAEGTVYLKKGGKLRWEYKEPTPQAIVSDGKKLWVYTPALNQVNVGDAPEALAGPAGSFLAGLGRLRAEFSVRFLNPARPQDIDGHWVLDLTPKQPLPTLARLVLVVDAETWEVRQAVVYDAFENTVTMRFTKVAINSSLPDGLFVRGPEGGRHRAAALRGKPGWPPRTRSTSRARSIRRRSRTPSTRRGARSRRATTSRARRTSCGSRRTRSSCSRPTT